MKDFIDKDGPRFEFFQAVRVLERLFPEREPVGGAAHPAREAARFGAHQTLRFPASEIQEVRISEGDNEPPQVTVNFMGLTGPSGVLPQHYTELLLERAYRKDPALIAFLDLFNHRMISLFYRAWEKYRFPVAYERGSDSFTRYLTSLIGMGTEGMERRLGFEDQGLLLYAGLIQQRPHSAVGLKSLLRDYFDLPVEVFQFYGHWVRLGEENQTRLGVQNHRLGFQAVLGSRIWDRQSKFRVRVGPMTCAAFEGFLPGGRSHGPLMQLSRFFAGLELDFDVQLVVQSHEVPACRLQSGGGGARLGLSSWLKVREFTHDADDPVLASKN
jgi:type VI secretion system protein ImpH